MKLLNYFIITICLLNTIVKAQYSNFDFVNNYNKTGTIIYGFKTGVTGYASLNTYFENLKKGDQIDAACDGYSTVLESLIRMYQCTKDKAYLYEFMRQTLALEDLRGTWNGGTNIFSFLHEQDCQMLIVHKKFFT